MGGSTYPPGPIHYWEFLLSPSEFIYRIGYQIGTRGYELLDPSF